MKALLKRLLPDKSTGRWVLAGLRRNPFRFPSAILSSFFITKKLSGSFLPLLVRISAYQKISVVLEKGATVKLGGKLLVAPWGGSCMQSSIRISTNGELVLDGDFIVGPNVHIEIGRGAKLNIGGVKNSSGSGITCDSRIMVEEHVSIGADSIIAWNVLISDSDWHGIEGTDRVAPVDIGEHVWIAHGASVLKGSTIPNGSIVASKSLVRAKFDDENSLLAGVPARVIRTGVRWTR